MTVTCRWRLRALCLDALSRNTPDLSQGQIACALQSFGPNECYELETDLALRDALRLRQMWFRCPNHDAIRGHGSSCSRSRAPAAPPARRAGVTTTRAAVAIRARAAAARAPAGEW